MAENEEKSRESQMHPSFIGVLRQKEYIKQKLSGIKRKIGVYSAKGGVGKTTVSVNLAYALTKKGFKVGLLDADIDCPNLPMFLGMDKKMSTESLPLKPIEKDGIKVASTALLVDETEKPIIWRGPIITKMLYDFLGNTDWGELDYLIIDMAPGTSDSQLTIMQVLDVDGFIIVTTPQRIAAVNSIRSGKMARRLSKQIIGVIENMSDQRSPENAEYVAKALDTEVIGRVPFNKAFNELSDVGRIPVMEEQGISELFLGIAGKVSGKG